MSTVQEDWVTPDPGEHVCERCERLDEQVFALKLVYDQPTFLCRACLVEAAVLANRETLAMGEVT